ncbi:MAG: methyltransferase domain-containing protein [Planctomycetes bacterium]|nr:methyltransferase domain-containing protein [Planctomycetota bacterium]
MQQQATTKTSDVESAVRARYTSGAEALEAALCCPIEGYEPRYLAQLPREIVEKDYGCGDPSRFIGPGEVVVDLGSGSGKIAYILAQKVGPQGRVIGVDVNDAMLALARKYQDEMATKLGYANTQFVKARIQDMALDLARVETLLARAPLHSVEALSVFEAECARLRREEPLVADASVDAVVSNCVLNLVRPGDKQRLFAEIFRVLKRGGRAVISDIVCDETPTAEMQADPELWSGCISGALGESELLKAFEDAGFHGIEILARSDRPWRTVQGIEFRSLTLRAWKGKQGVCLERKQAVVYKGPWKQVVDDDGHTFRRGERIAVCDKTYQILTGANGPYGAQVVGLPPRVEVPLKEAGLFACRGTTLRSPRETKGESYAATEDNSAAACTDDACC